MHKRRNIVEVDFGYNPDCHARAQIEAYLDKFFDQYEEEGLPMSVLIETILLAVDHVSNKSNWDSGHFRLSRSTFRNALAFFTRQKLNAKLVDLDTGEDFYDAALHT